MMRPGKPWRAWRGGGGFRAAGMALLWGLLLPTLALAHPGELDPHFGTGGLVHTDFGGQEELGLAVALDKDGRIYVGGSTGALNQPADFLVVRYTADGLLD